MGNQNNLHIYFSSILLQPKAYFPNNLDNNGSQPHVKHKIHSVNLDNGDKNKALTKVEAIHNYKGISLGVQLLDQMDILFLLSSFSLWTGVTNGHKNVSKYLLVSSRKLLAYLILAVYEDTLLQVEIYRYVQNKPTVCPCIKQNRQFSNEYFFIVGLFEWAPEVTKRYGNP